ncbi:MAG: DUF4861 domain-containing protein [Bacteroidales bacterium]|nr:DUF4861 domain-containing protein [Bacteroidales bacterium]
MKRQALIFAFAAILAFAGCQPKAEGPKVMARAVPERADDFVFENNLIAGRFYGKALEGNPTSPGIDIWVKMPGRLVADEWYAEAQKDPEYYHHNHGEGKDCYKVSVSLGGGASAPLIGGVLALPPTNYRSFDIVEQTPDKVVFVLHYPEWEAAEGIKVALDKQVTVCADSYFCRVDDSYRFSGTDTLTVAAGLLRHSAQETIEQERLTSESYAIWEHASDQSIEPEDGMLGVAVVVPGAKNVCVHDELDHGIATREIVPGEVFSYYFGSCWSKGDLKTAEDWFAEVEKQK